MSRMVEALVAGVGVDDDWKGGGDGKWRINEIEPLFLRPPLSATHPPPPPYHTLHHARLRLGIRVLVFVMFEHGGALTRGVCRREP